MADTITTTLTEAKKYNKDIILIPAIRDPLIMSDYRLMGNKRAGTHVLNLASTLNEIVRTKSGCGFEAAGSMTITEKNLVVCGNKVNLEQCYDDFTQNQLDELLKTGTGLDDLTGTSIEDLLLTRTREALVRDIFKLAWFADVDNTGSAFYGKCADGYFIDLEDNLPSGQKTTITTTGSLTSDEALTYFKELYETKAPQTLKAIAPNEKRFYVTSTIYYNLMDTYEQLGTDSGLARLANGGALSFRGIPVIEYSTWDTVIAALSLPDPHRIVYTTPQNLLIGSDVQLPGEDVKVFFDELNEKLYVKALFTLGTKYLFDEWAAYAR